MANAIVLSSIRQAVVIEQNFFKCPTSHILFIHYTILPCFVNDMELKTLYTALFTYSNHSKLHINHQNILAA